MSNCVRFVLMDIEGTTTSIDFVHQTLFPYSKATLSDFLEQNQSDSAVSLVLSRLETRLGEKVEKPEGIRKIASTLERWIEEDRKDKDLKTLQGLQWKTGYARGDFVSHLYEDVVPSWERWAKVGIGLGIYSSGSVQAQKLLFAHTQYGDVREFLSGYYDTTVGHKRESSSYQYIRKSLGFQAPEIVFLSDIAEELDAAKVAGFQTIQVVRPGTVSCERHHRVSKFDEIKFGAG